MTETSGRHPVRLRWMFEALLSIFATLLIVSANLQAHKSPWAERLYFHYYPHPPGAFADYYGVALAGFLLVWFLAGAMFLLLRLTARFPLTETGLRILGGIVAATGYPLMVLYTSRDPLLFVELEVGVAVVFAVLYSVRRWPFSRGASILLLVLHFGWWSGGVWGFFLRGTHKIYVEMWPGWLLLWPGWYWKSRGHEVMGLVFNSVYPLLALSCALVWILYVKRSGARRDIPVPDPAST